ncbi:DUF1285 domain-containing protein [Sphingomonas alba]|uniref:DUF1285 domain-containing protein n=1 Tax=Sphingomonas alba TaxID=2908208 RepID=A0ABT0RNL0_9SPHN|nr:DUF1285 domain-containing protein [Sphingomonas alba]MCL6684226.1 DUF1285 domain-containing protein [Sphingomonas alba]
MPETRQPIRVAGQPLDALAEVIGARRLPPVERWDPALCGHSCMRIAADGSWYHNGERIERPAMVRLFSTVLRREPDGSHVLVTPVEKLTIDVDVTPFRALAMSHEGDGEKRRIAFEIDSGDAVILGAAHPLRMIDETPRIEVRNGLEAIVARPLYYELADIALAEGHQPPGIWSDGCFFPL